MPRTFINARQALRAIKAQASSCQPHTIHKKLLSKNTQKPAYRFGAAREPTSQAASNEAAMAGHCRKLMKSDMRYTSVPEV
jgi:hypothetical protein